MSDLETRLKAIDIGNESYATLDDDAIEQIKQVFADAGYVQVETPTDEMMAEWKKADEEFGLMTGAEWYDRFSKELEAMFIPFARTVDGEERLMIDEIDQAAKRASGIPQAPANTLPIDDELFKPPQTKNKQFDPFDYVQPCELVDCTPERHAYHQGQWDMAVRINKASDILEP